MPAPRKPVAAPRVVSKVVPAEPSKRFLVLEYDDRDEYEKETIKAIEAATPAAAIRKKTKNAPRRGQEYVVYEVTGNPVFYGGSHGLHNRNEDRHE